MLTAKTGRELRRRDADAPEPGSLPLVNSRHETLAREFAAGNSMTDAWRAIGRDPAKSNNAWRTFRRPDIQARIEYLRSEWNRLAGLSLGALQTRLLRIADANVVDFFEADATTKRLRLRNLTELPRVITSAIAELQIDAKGAVKVRTSDRLRALEVLLKTIGADPDDSSAAMTLEQLILGSMASGASNSSPHVPAANGAPLENQIEAQMDVRRVRLDRVRIQRSV
jgi:hypothetical protein